MRCEARPRTTTAQRCHSMPGGPTRFLPSFAFFSNLLGYWERLIRNESNPLFIHLDPRPDQSCDSVKCFCLFDRNLTLSKSLWSRCLQGSATQFWQIIFEAAKPLRTITAFRNVT